MSLLQTERPSNMPSQRTLRGLVVSTPTVARPVAIRVEVLPSVRQIQAHSTAAVARFRLTHVEDPGRLERVAQAIAVRMVGAEYVGTPQLFAGLSDAGRDYFLTLALEALRAAGLER